MNTIRNFGLFFSIIFILNSCSPSLSVTTDYDRSADFSKYKTFAFYDLADKSGSLSDLNRNRIINAVKTEMKNKGFTETSSNPDVMVNVTTVLVNKQSVTADTNTYGYGGYYRPYRWGGSYSGTTTYNVYNYKDGSLIIDIIDAEKNQLVWQGTGNKEIDKPSSNPDQTISEAVAKIMSSYPPGVKK
ncbi:DUF4136 domain-containing protein [Flavobacterium maritimum]|uniref:DUF4136 domain-containing protein n=1 Tax=Flavobacterium maritimum TaxID=3149042 RepID=UPI0032B3BB42